MAYETPHPGLLDLIRLNDVASRAGVSTGALYHYWGSQEQYREELLEELLSARRYEVGEVVEHGFHRAVADGIPIVDLIRELSQYNLEQFIGNEDFRVQMAFWMTDDPSCRKRIANQYAEVAASWTSIYRASLDAYGLVLRPPFTFEWLTTLLTALLEGLVIRQRVDPSAVPLDGIGGEHGGQGAGPFSCPVPALLPSVTQARADPPEDVRRWVSGLTRSPAKNSPEAARGDQTGGWEELSSGPEG